MSWFCIHNHFDCLSPGRGNLQNPEHLCNDMQNVFIADNFISIHIYKFIIKKKKQKTEKNTASPFCGTLAGICIYYLNPEIQGYLYDVNNAV